MDRAKDYINVLRQEVEETVKELLVDFSDKSVNDLIQRINGQIEIWDLESKYMED